MDYPHLYIKSGPYGIAIEEIQLEGKSLMGCVKALSFSVSAEELTTVHLTFHGEVEVDGPVGELLAVHPGCRYDPDDRSWEVDSRCGLPHYAELS